MSSDFPDPYSPDKHPCSRQHTCHAWPFWLAIAALLVLAFLEPVLWLAGY